MKNEKKVDCKKCKLPVELCTGIPSACYALYNELLARKAKGEAVSLEEYKKRAYDISRRAELT